MYLKLNFLGFRTKLFIAKDRERNQAICGYTNRCKDGQYIIFLDYDRLDLDMILDELKHIQELFDLGEFYIFQSSEKSFHAVCLDKVPLKQYAYILDNASIDVRYMHIPLYWGKKLWTLRLTDKRKEKIKFICVLESKNNNNLQSQAHAIVLNKLFKLDIKLNNPDKEKELTITRYYI